MFKTHDFQYDYSICGFLQGSPQIIIYLLFQIKNLFFIIISLKLESMGKILI